MNSEENNTGSFVRNEGLGPLKEIVERNKAHEERLEYKKPDDDAVANPEPTYEPDANNGVALKRISTDNVFKRGGYKKVSSSRKKKKK